MSENALGLASVRDLIVAEKRLNLSFVQGVVFHSNLLHKSANIYQIVQGLSPCRSGLALQFTMLSNLNAKGEWTRNLIRQFTLINILSKLILKELFHNLQTVVCKYLLKFYSDLKFKNTRLLFILEV